ncbi:MAG: hypothetical protein K2Q18_05100, partial [Bdellovibrionales bacterium]|nr:hypothetical protein [Bdellovibrionales bacterium]
MKKVLLGISLILSFLISLNAFAQSYNGMTERQMIDLYKQSCEQEQFANCYQLGLIYKKYPETIIDKNEEDPKLNRTGAQLAKENFEKACSAGEKVACKELKGEGDYEGAMILYYAALVLIFLAVFLV